MLSSTAFAALALMASVQANPLTIARDDVPAEVNIDEIWPCQSTVIGFYHFDDVSGYLNSLSVQPLTCRDPRLL